MTNYELMRRRMIRSFEVTSPSDVDVIRRMSRRKSRHFSLSAASFGWSALALAAMVSVGVMRPWRIAPEASYRASSEHFEVQAARPAHLRSDSSSADEQSGVVIQPTKVEPRLARPTGTGRASTGSDGAGNLPASLRANAAPSGSTAHWEDIARALREGNETKAKLLARELGESPDAETRDNARLTYLRLELSSPETAPLDGPKYVAELEALRERGATSSVRASARRLLLRLKQGPQRGEPPTFETAPEK